MNYLNKPDMGGAPQLKGAAKDTQRRQEHKRDEAMHTAPVPGMRQNDGNVTAAPVRPTKKGTIQGAASPAKYNTSGMETALGGLADKLHPKRR